MVFTFLEANRCWGDKLFGKNYFFDNFVASVFWREVPNLQNVGVNKIAAPPISATKFYDPPHHWYTLPPKQAKLYWNQSFWTKYTHCGHLVTPYILVIKNLIMTPLLFFPKIDDPNIFGTPILKKMIAPFKVRFCTDRSLYDNLQIVIIIIKKQKKYLVFSCIKVTQFSFSKLRFHLYSGYHYSKSLLKWNFI